MDDCRRKFVAFCLVLTISVSQLLGSVANLCDCDLHSNQSHLHLDTFIECSPAWMADHDDHKDDHRCLSDLITQEAYNTHAFDVSPSHDEHPPHGMIVVLAIDWHWMDSTIIFSSHTHSFARHSSGLCLNCPWPGWVCVTPVAKRSQTEATSWLSSTRHGTLAPLRC